MSSLHDIAQRVDCPVCGGSDMEAVEQDDGRLIRCTNLACASNGGDNAGAPVGEVVNIWDDEFWNARPCAHGTTAPAFCVECLRLSRKGAGGFTAPTRPAEPDVVDYRGKPLTADDLRASFDAIMRAPALRPAYGDLMLTQQQRDDILAVEAEYRRFLDEVARAPRFNHIAYKFICIKAPCARCGEGTRFCRPRGARWTPMHLRCEMAPQEWAYERRGPIPDYRRGGLDEWGEQLPLDLNRHDRKRGYTRGAKL